MDYRKGFMALKNTSPSFVSQLCFGDIEEDLILPFPKMAAAEQETLKSIQTSLEHLLRPHEADFALWDEAGSLPPDFVDELRQFGLFSLVIPEAFGGMELSATGYSRTLQELTQWDGSVSVTVGAHSSIGMRGLNLFGTEEQKERYLPKLATGKMIAAFCLTEPSAGSDAGSIKTSAVRDGDHWILNGGKLWITNGGIAQFYTVFAKTDPKAERGGVTAFIVTSDMKGVTHGPHESKMGIRASSTTTVSFEDVRVPVANVLGEVGKGFKVAMRILNSGRTGLGGGAVGLMKKMIRLSTSYSKEREQFGKPIAEFEMIKEKIGLMVVDAYAAESAVNMVNHFIDSGFEDYAVEAAIIKVFASEAAWRAVDEALQIAGGNGYMREFPYERAMRDARINRIFEGTNEILRLFIALTAMNEVGSQLQELSLSLKGIFDNPIKGFGVISEYAVRRASFATGVIKRNGSHFSRLHPSLKDLQASFEEMTRDLAAAVDSTLRRFGKRIIGQQFLSHRLADMMVDLFVLASVLSRVSTAISEGGAAAAAHEFEIAQVFSSQVKRRFGDNFAQLSENEDLALKGVADFTLAMGGYHWDNIS